MNNVMGPDNKIADGWLNEIKRIPSPNCDDRPLGVEISLIVIHGISLPPGEFGGKKIEALFTNELDPGEHPYFRDISGGQVSAHVVIYRDASVIQFVPFYQRAWHAGESCFEEQSHCNDYSIGIELEGSDDIPYEELQYQKLAEVIRVLCESYPGITHQRVVGHCDIAPGRKTDPGQAFNWQHLYTLLGSPE